MVLEGKDIIQINVTVIAGILILLTISSLGNTHTAPQTDFSHNPKLSASITVGCFAISSMAEIICSMTVSDYAQKRIGAPWSRYNFGLYAMFGGFFCLVYMAGILYSDVLSLAITN